MIVNYNSQCLCALISSVCGEIKTVWLLSWFRFVSLFLLFKLYIVVWTVCWTLLIEQSPIIAPYSFTLSVASMFYEFVLMEKFETTECIKLIAIWLIVIYMELKEKVSDFYKNEQLCIIVVIWLSVSHSIFFFMSAYKLQFRNVFFLSFVQSLFKMEHEFWNFWRNIFFLIWHNLMLSTGTN